LLKNKRIVHEVGILKSLCYDARSEKHQIIRVIKSKLMRLARHVARMAARGEVRT